MSKHLVAAWAASTVYGGGYEAALVADGRYDPDSHRWASAVGVPQTLRADLGTAKIATWCKIKPSSIYAQDLDAFTIQASNDATFATGVVTLATITAQGGQWDEAARTFTFTNTTAYRYYRLNISAVGTDNIASAVEVEWGDKQPYSVTYNRTHNADATYNYFGSRRNYGVTVQPDQAGRITHYNVHNYVSNDLILRVYDGATGAILDETPWSDTLYESRWVDVPLTEPVDVVANAFYLIALETPNYYDTFPGNVTATETYDNIKIPLAPNYLGSTAPQRYANGSARPSTAWTGSRLAIGAVFQPGIPDVAYHTASATQETIFTSTRIVVEHTNGGGATHEITQLTSMSPIIADQEFGDAKTETRIGRQRSIDPETGKAKYRLILVERDGTRIGELTKADITEYSQNLNAGSMMTFTVKTTNPLTKELKIPNREIQFWRGNVLEDWLVLGRGRSDGSGKVSFTAVSQHWYFEHRVIGKVPIPNLLQNGSFEDGEKHWNFTWVSGSIPAMAPVHRIDDDTINGLRSLYIEGSSAVQITTTTLEGDVNFAFDSYALTPAGQASIANLCAAITVPNPTMKVAGHTDNNGSTSYNYTLGLNRAQSVKNEILSHIPGANISIVSYGETRPIASNATSTGRAKNRRVEIDYSYTQTAKGHRQYAGQSFEYINPTSAKKAKTLTLVGWTKILQYLGPSKDGWGVYMQAVEIAPTHRVPEKPFATASVSIDADTPKDRWTRMECSLDIPANGKTYRIDVRLYPPEGKCIWDEISVTASDQLAFFDVDEALIVKGLVEHAQDPAMGKSPLGILTRTPLTGVKRTREYPWIERMQISEALAEWPTLNDGMDITFEFTPTTKTVATHYPRKVSYPDYVLALGANVAQASGDSDGTQVATQVIVQAEGDGSDREEGVYTDTSSMDGVILEKVYNATPGSAISSLKAQAKRGVKRWAHPIVMPSLTMKPEYTDELLETLSLGDVVEVRVDDGWLNLDGMFRLVSRTIETNADQITYELAPEIELT